MRGIDFNVDWGHEWPLWTDLGAGHNAEPDDIGGLSEPLIAAMRRFYDFWEAHYIFDEGWDSREHLDAAQADAARLVVRLRLETAGRFEVQNGFTGSFRKVR